MANRLTKSKLIDFERYGVITMTKKGFSEGKRLATRREILVQLYRFIGVEEEYVEKEVKKIENDISRSCDWKNRAFFEEKTRSLK